MGTAKKERLVGIFAALDAVGNWSFWGDEIEVTDEDL
jgi:hypothetical protein